MAWYCPRCRINFIEYQLIFPFCNIDVKAALEQYIANCKRYRYAVLAGGSRFGAMCNKHSLNEDHMDWTYAATQILTGTDLNNLDNGYFLKHFYTQNDETELPKNNTGSSWGK